MLRVKGQDGFLPLGPELVPAAEFDPTDYTLRTYLNGDVVQEATAGDLHVRRRLPARRPLPGDHARAGRRDPHRHAGELAADEAGRRRRGRDHGHRPPDEHDRGVGRRPRRPGRAAPGLGADAPRRARDPRGRGRADGGGGQRRRDPPRPDRPRRASASRTSTRRPHVGASSSGSSSGRATMVARYLACNDEPYSLELVGGGRPGHDHVAFELARDCSLDDARAHLDGARRRVARSGRARSWLADPDGRAIQLLPYRAPATELDRWPQHARPSTTVHLGGPRRLGHVNCLTGDIHANAALLHRGARDAALRLARRRRASGSTSTRSTT